MRGKIVKGIAGFYYVHAEDLQIYECRARGIFRRENIKPLVGDDVELEVLDQQEKEGNIRKILPRRSRLIRPAVANIDQALVIFAIRKPEPNFNLLDRFLIMMEQQGLPSVICFNKSDIASAQDRADLQSAYETCGYQVFFISVKEEEGLAGKNDHGGGAKRCGKIFSDQLSVSAGGDGDRRRQRKDRQRQAYHPPFGVVCIGWRKLYYGYAGVFLPAAF